MSEIRRITIGLSVMVLGLYIFLLSNPPWDTPTSSTQFYSVLAFLTIAITVSALTRTRTDPTPANYVFTSGTAYASLIFGGASIYYLLTPEAEAIQSQTSGVLLNLIALASAGFIMMLYSYLEGKTFDDDSKWNSRYLAPIITTIGTLIFVSFMIISRLALGQTIYLLGGYSAGIAAVILYLISIVFLYRKTKTAESHDLIRLQLSFLLLAISSAVLVFILPSPNSMWLVSIVLMALAFVFAVIATTYPYLTSIGISNQASYGISAGLSALVILPFLVANLVENISTINYLPDIGAAILIHVGGGIFAAVMSYTLYNKTKQQPAQYRNSIILAMLLWASTEFSLAISAMFHLISIETDLVMPYAIGILGLLVLVTQAIRRTLTPREDKAELLKSTYLSVYLITICILTVIANLLVNQFVIEILSLGLGKALVLILSYSSLFLLSYFILLLTVIHGGKLTMDTLVVGSMTIWLVVIILKVNFALWTPGFWVAEALIAMCIVALPIGLTIIYVRENQDLKLIQSRVATFSSFLTEHITNHHKRALDSLDDLSKSMDLDDDKLKILSRSLDNISIAEDLAKYIGVLIYSDSFPPEALESVDFVDSIAAGFSRLARIEPDFHAQISINKEKGQCYVTANSLLSDAFFQIFNGVMKRVGIPSTFSVDIKEIEEGEINVYQSTLSMIVQSDDVEQLQGLLRRYTEGKQYAAIEFEYANRVINLFGGKVAITSKVPESNQLEVIFQISLFNSA